MPGSLQEVFEKLLPVYALVGFGYVAGRSLKLEPAPLGRLLVYILGPVVAFCSVLKLPLSASRLSLPLVFFLFCATLGTMARFLGKRFGLSQESGVLAYAAGSGNSGFFGFPLVLALLGENYLGIAVLASLGFVAFENSLGFYWAARGKYSAAQSLRKVLGLPTLSCTGLAIVFNLSGHQDLAWAGDIPQLFRSTYIVLGMFLLGVGVASISLRRLSGVAYLAVGLTTRLLFWPLLVAAGLWLDAQFLHFLDPECRRVARLYSIVPPPILSVAIAAMFGTAMAETALFVLLGTVLSLGFIPGYLTLFPL